MNKRVAVTGMGTGMAEQSKAGRCVLRVSACSFAVVLVVLDQISKWFVLEHVLAPAANALHVPRGFFAWMMDSPRRLEPVWIEVTSFFNWVMVWNEGVSFGLFGGSGASPWVMIALALIVSAGFCIWMLLTASRVQALALAMIVGGALGNVIDRIRFGAVADFLDFHVWGYHWPAFNLADSCITLGVALILVDGLFLAPSRERAQERAA